MAKDFDPYHLSNPFVFVLRMVLFVVVAAFVPFILYRPLYTAFQANILLNGLIVFVLCVGTLFAFLQVIRLFPEVRWVNDFRRAGTGLEVARPPTLLAPMASLLGDRAGENVSISPQTMRSLLDSIALRLDESREISRYLTGLLVFLGLLGTFWGLLETVSSVGDTIKTLSVTSGDAAVIFEDLKAGLEAPLSGMGTAFSSSLFGLAGSLVLGFLDLQAGQAQNRFYNELEDWLSTLTEISFDDLVAGSDDSDASGQLASMLERLNQNMQEGGSNRASTMAMANLAEGIQSLVQHMRHEQQMNRKWVESQAEQQAEIKSLLQKLNRSMARPRTTDRPSGGQDQN